MSKQNFMDRLLDGVAVEWKARIMKPQNTRNTRTGNNGKWTSVFLVSSVVKNLPGVDE